jgi:hypothetical protein
MSKSRSRNEQFPVILSWDDCIDLMTACSVAANDLAGCDSPSFVKRRERYRHLYDVLAALQPTESGRVSGMLTRRQA